MERNTVEVSAEVKFGERITAISGMFKPCQNTMMYMKLNTAYWAILLFAMFILSGCTPLC